MDIKAECPMFNCPQVSDGRKLAARIMLMHMSVKR
jgi:hypothetical protein